MHQVGLRNSYEQMGYQQAHPLTGWNPPPPETKSLRFVRQFEQILGQDAPERRFGTLWSVAGHPGERRSEIASGHPCREAWPGSLPLSRLLRSWRNV